MGLGNELKILFLAAEAAPFVKVGGLGDVAGTLPLYLRSLSTDSFLEKPNHEKDNLTRIDIRLVIPFHRAINVEEYEFKYLTEFELFGPEGSLKAEVFLTTIDGLPVYLISGLPISESEQIYSQDTTEDGFKYTFFSLASLKMVKEINWIPDIIHANDWHTSPAIYALSLNQKSGGFFQDTITLLGVHNLPYLGVGASSALRAFGLPPATGSDLPTWAQDVPLPLGMLTADHIVTVSPTYAQEILTPDFSAGLHTFLQGRRESISGILNGIDIDRWNPEDDEFITSNYQQKNLNNKLGNKTDLLNEFGLPADNRRPLLAMVTRLDHQKGVDLAFEALRGLMDQPWNAIVLGTGDPALEQRAMSLEKDFPDRVRSVIRFDGPLSHRIYAGSDMLLIPSRYEPCGLTQMIAMRYGTVPIGRATGGLRDTVFDYNYNTNSTGFVFQSSTSRALLAAMRRALNIYQDQRRWKGLQRRGMRQNYSWGASARKYNALYQQLIDEKSK